jgi:hypothetical protein
VKGSAEKRKTRATPSFFNSATNLGFESSVRSPMLIGTEILYIKSCTFYLVKITKRAQGYCIARALIRMHYNRLFLIETIGVVIGFEKLAPYIRVCFAIEVMAKDILLFLC